MLCEIEHGELHTLFPIKTVHDLWKNNLVRHIYCFLCTGGMNIKSQQHCLKTWMKTFISNYFSSQVSSWSKRWFTHIFLFVVVLLYSIAGAMIFITVEGTHEDILNFNIRKERYELLNDIFNGIQTRLVNNWAIWKLNFSTKQFQRCIHNIYIHI